MANTTGKAHAVIPAFTFYRDRTGDEDEKQGKRGNKIKKKPIIVVTDLFSQIMKVESEWRSLFG